MQISARNQLSGTITAIDVDGVTAEVTIDIGDGKLVTGVITRGSVERLGLQVGSTAIAVIKATDVLFGIEDSEVSL